MAHAVFGGSIKNALPISLLAFSISTTPHNIFGKQRVLTTIAIQLEPHSNGLRAYGIACATVSPNL
jgi:hypothetical protein